VSPKSKVRKKPPKHRDPSPRARQAAIEAARKSKRRTWSVATVVLIVIIVFGLSQVVGDGDGDTDVETATSTSVPTQRPPVSLPTPAQGASITGDTPCPAADGSAPRTTSFAKVPPMCIVASKTYIAEMQTSKGLITIALDPQAAPQAVNNFVVLARYHYFDTLPFHRIVTGFVIQGGSPDGSGNGNPGYQFADEVPATAAAYKPGSLAMANSGKNTNGSQFFIVVNPAPLQPLYSLFGQVTGGTDVVAAIDAAGTPDTDPNTGQPTEVVTIRIVTIKES
jgi:cyclophilin family peptidyl-prolyl cis-trans isomerase